MFVKFEGPGSKRRYAMGKHGQRLRLLQLGLTAHRPLPFSAGPLWPRDGPSIAGARTLGTLWRMHPCRE